MISKNIFTRTYETPENKLTESFIRLLSVLERKSLRMVLDRFDLKFKNNSLVKFEMQQRGENSVPDAVISLGDEYLIHIEVKRVYSSLDWRQIRNHIQYLAKKRMFARRILWIIVPDIYEPKELAIKAKNMCKSSDFTFKHSSWSEIGGALDSSSKVAIDTKDKFLITQFLEYLREERVITMDRPINKKDYQDWSRVSEWIEQIEHFLKKDIREYISLTHKDFIAERISRDGRQIFLHFYTDQSKKLHFYVGFDPGVYGDDDWNDPCFYVGWAMRTKKFRQIENTDSFIKKEKVLQNKKFIHFRDEGRKSFYRQYKLEDLVKVGSINQQVLMMKKFIDDSISQFNKIGLRKIL